MKESISSVDQLEQKRTKVNSALDKVGKLITTPSSISNNNLRLTVEEASRLPIQERVIPLTANVTKRKKIQQNLQEKTEPYLKSLGLKINDEILKRETKEDSDSILDEKGIFALASIWASNPNLAAEYGVEPLPQQVVLNLQSLIGEDSLPTQERQKEIAASVLVKILEVVNGDKLDQVYDSQPPPVQDLLLHFTTIDPESVVNFLNKALSECDETVQPTTLAEPIVDKMPESPKLKEIERRDAQVRQTVRGTLDRIEAHRINKPVSTVQLVKFFPNLKAKFVTQIEEDKRYITPERGRDGRHPVFNREEITFLLYVREHGNNLTPRLVKDLKEIIAEEIEQRSQNNGNKNGATKDQSGQQITIEQPPGPRVNGPKLVSSPEKPKPEDEAEILAQDLSAINLYIENSQIALSEVTTILGEGETLSTAQVREKLAETATKLHEKISQGIASQRETSIWEKIKNSTNMEEDKNALRELRSGINAWGLSQKRQVVESVQVTAQVELKPDLLLGTVLQTPLEAAKPLVENDQITPDDRRSTPKAGWREKFLSRFQRKDKKEDITAGSDKQKKANTETTLPISHKEHPPQEYLDRINEELIKRLSADLKALEMDHPAVRADIYMYFDMMSKVRNWPLNPQRLIQLDPCLTWMPISTLIEKNLISKNNSSGRPTFSKGDVALALFVLHHDIDITQDNLKDLRQIIKEEEAYRSKLNKS